ncbi:hypothetical protein [Anaerosporobacter faecicola]|uniref:hypothetical protein n=1 Tax=Anaerosporobacter faecicola TaxID=2718714 RepID=UPI0014397EE9|nr:hypothetical protein [Anaerosporobacter faecicola]
MLDSQRNDLMKSATELSKAHRKAFEHWNEGEIVKVWIDTSGNTCIEYESGNWWHYNERGEWW